MTDNAELIERAKNAATELRAYTDRTITAGIIDELVTALEPPAEGTREWAMEKMREGLKVCNLTLAKNSIHGDAVVPFNLSSDGYIYGLGRSTVDQFLHLHYPNYHKGWSLHQEPRELVEGELRFITNSAYAPTKTQQYLNGEWRDVPVVKEDQ